MTDTQKTWTCDSCDHEIRYWYTAGLPDVCPECETKIVACEGCVENTTHRTDNGRGDQVGLCSACAAEKIVCHKCGKADPKRVAWGNVCRACYLTAPAPERFRLQMEDLLGERAVLSPVLRADILRHIDDVCAHYESMLSPVVPVRRVPANTSGDWRAAS